MLDLSRLDNIIQIAKKKYKYLRPEVVWRVLGKPKNIYLDEAGKIVSYLEEKLGRICWDQSEAIEIHMLSNNLISMEEAAILKRMEVFSEAMSSDPNEKDLETRLKEIDDRTYNPYILRP